MTGCRSGSAMKFLLDVCAASRAMHAALVRWGHDVASALETAPQADDEAILDWARAEQRILVTEDKDFGELVFVRRLPHSCIIRIVDMRVQDKVAAMQDLIEGYSDSLRDGMLIVVTENRVRIRSSEAAETGGT